MKTLSQNISMSEMESEAARWLEGKRSENIELESNVLHFLRSACISDISSSVFNSDSDSCVPEDREAVVKSLVDKYFELSAAEKLLFFLMIPSPVENLSVVKNCQFVARAEIKHTITWIRTHLEEDRDFSIPKRDVYDQYLKHCQAFKLKPISTADFGKVMKQVFPNVRPRRLGTRGNSQYCYSGMRSCFSLERPQLYSSPDHDNGQSDEKSYSRQSSAETMEDNDTNLNEVLTTLKQEDVAGTHFEIFPTLDIYGGGCSKYITSDPKMSPSQCSESPLNKEIECSNQCKELNDEEDPYSVSNELGNSKENLNAMDCQIEEEIAQYFQQSQENFVVPSSRASIESGRTSIPYFSRSQSCSGVGKDYNRDYYPNRCSSTVECLNPSSQTSFVRRSLQSAESFTSGSYSSCYSTNPNDPNNFPNIHMLLQRPASAFIHSSTTPCYETTTRPQSSNNDHHLRFTPIPFSQKKLTRIKPIPRVQEKAGYIRGTLRPRSYSTTGVKCGFKRNFTSAFVKPKSGAHPVATHLETSDELIKCSVNPRSQSLPHFPDCSQQNLSVFESLLGDVASNTACESFSESDYLTGILKPSEKSSSVGCENIGENFLFGQHILPTLGEVFAGKQMETDEVLDKETVIEQRNEEDLLSEMFALWPEPCLGGVSENVHSSTGSSTT